MVVETVVKAGGSATVDYILDKQEKDRVQALEADELTKEVNRDLRKVAIVTVLRDKGLTEQLVPLDSPLRKWDTNADGCIESPSPDEMPWKRKRSEVHPSAGSCSRSRPGPGSSSSPDWHVGRAALRCNLWVLVLVGGAAACSAGPSPGATSAVDCRLTVRAEMGITVVGDKGLADQLVPQDSPLRKWDVDGDGRIDVPPPPLPHADADAWDDFTSALEFELRRGSPIGRVALKISDWTETFRAG